MSTTPESQREVGRQLLQHVERGTFHTTCGTDGSDRGDPDTLIQDVHTFASVWLKHPEHTRLDQCIARLPVEPFDFEYNVADWHAETIPVEPIARAHVLRLVKDWGETALARYLENEPELAETMGFDTPPGQKALWTAWNKRFSDRHRDALQQAASEIVALARHYGVPAPDKVFRPDRGTNKTEAQVTIDKSREVWKKAKPFVTDAFYLDRGENAQIPESAFWEQHAFIGSRKDMFAESGHTSFLGETTRERAPTGSNHRYQIRKHDPEDVREMLHNATEKLVERGRRDSELVGSLTAAIDITKSKKYTGKYREKHEKHILGYKNKQTDEIDYHFQWATIQIVGLDIPLVLDAIPIVKGESPRHEIVDKLLSNALEIVDDIELVMMDREFDNEAVKNVCDRHGVYYLNPAQKNSSERGKCTDLRKSEKRVDIETQQLWNGTERHRIYLPARNSDMWDEESEEDDEDDEDEEEGEEPTMRQELINEFTAEVLDDTAGEDGKRRMFDDVLSDVEEEEAEQETRGSDEDKQLYALFETNHPEAVPDEDELEDEDDEESLSEEEQRLQHVQEFISRYGHRWGIENGFKKIKKFMARTTSTCHRYRFFNFAFACVLYNVWRIVDLLVKLAFEDDPDYEPRVDAGTFLSIAKDYLGLGPPD